MYFSYIAENFSAQLQRIEDLSNQYHGFSTDKFEIYSDYFGEGDDKKDAPDVFKELNELENKIDFKFFNLVRKDLTPIFLNGAYQRPGRKKWFNASDDDVDQQMSDEHKADFQFSLDQIEIKMKKLVGEMEDIINIMRAKANKARNLNLLH